MFIKNNINSKRTNIAPTINTNTYKYYFYILLIIVIVTIILPFEYYRSISKYLYPKINSIIAKDNSFNEHYHLYFGVSKRFYNPLEIIIRYFKGVFVQRDAFHLNISMKNYQKLNHRVYLARSRGKIISADKNVLVNAKINYQRSEYKTKIRLKGLYLDHLIGRRWSFRIKLKDNKHILGMNRFSIHNPATRNFMNEWLYHRMLNHVGLISLYYDFVDLYINGDYIGVYAIEEFPNLDIIEKNRRRDGILLKNGIRDNDGSIYNFVYQQNKVNKNIFLSKTYKLYKSAIYQFANNNIKYDSFYDYDKLAKYAALTELFGGGHGNLWDNYVMYYNPLTSKVEVIGYDGNSGDKLTTVGLQIEPRASYFYKSSELNKIYHDKDFFKKYLYYIMKFSQPDYFDEFFKNISSDYYNNSIFLAKERPWQDPKPSYFYNNQKYVIKYFAKFIKDFSVIEDSTVLDVMKYHNIKPVDNTINTSSSESNIMLQNSNLGEFSFITFYNDSKSAVIKKGNYTISSNLIIPKNINFTIEAGVNLKLINSASILSYSSISLNGEVDDPINIVSNPDSRSSVIVAYTRNVSKIQHTNFKNLSHPSSMESLVTGSVTFYEANVHINNCNFQSNLLTDDSLNIVRSQFHILNSQFTNSLSDAIDIDFSTGRLDNLSIINSGNDGIDFSHSIVSGDKLYINDSLDKGISIGEQSEISMKNIQIEKSKYGIVIKDDSSFHGENINLANTDYGLALYRKKREYKSPSSSINNIQFDKILKNNILLEANSKLLIDGKSYLKYTYDTKHFSEN